MSKVLLIYENYTELNSVQFTLQKVGFDCIGISTEFGTAEQVISFNPDVVIACGKGGKVTTVGVGRRLKEMPRWTGKAILIFASDHQPKPEDLIKIRMDMVLEAPVENIRLIQALAKLTHQDDQALIEKLLKAVTPENTSKDVTFISGEKTTTEKIVVSRKDGAAKEPVAKNNSTQGKTNDDQGQPQEAVPSRPTVSEPDTVFVAEPMGPSAFDDLNRREQARTLRKKAQFSLRPEPDFEPKGPVAVAIEPAPRVGGGDLVEKEAPQEQAELEPKKEAKTNLESSMDVSIDRQEVDWSEMEKQLFNLPSTPTAEKTEVVEVKPAQFSLNPAASAAADAVPYEAPALKLDFGQQIRQAEDALVQKMKAYKQIGSTEKVLWGAGLKKTATRKAQIELMKGVKQVELEKQDGLRREFTKALFSKK